MLLISFLSLILFVASFVWVFIIKVDIPTRQEEEHSKNNTVKAAELKTRWEKSEKDGKKRRIRFNFMIQFFFLFTLLFLHAIAAKSKIDIDEKTALTIDWFFFSLLFYALYVVKTFRFVGASDIGATGLFGNFVENLEPGLHLCPWLFYSFLRESAQDIDREFPEEPENVQKSNQDAIEPGKKAPIRVMAGGTKEGSEDPLDSRITAELQFVAVYSISNLVFFQRRGLHEVIEKKKTS